MNAFVLPGLKKRREELAAEIESAHLRLKHLIKDLDALDGAIRVFDPSYPAKIIAASRTRRDAYRERRPITRHVLDVLRTTSGPMSPTRIMELLPDDFGERGRKLTLRVSRALRELRAKGTVQQHRITAKNVLWCLTN